MIGEIVHVLIENEEPVAQPCAVIGVPEQWMALDASSIAAARNLSEALVSVAVLA
jgi:hypothetical protein